MKIIRAIDTKKPNSTSKLELFSIWLIALSPIIDSYVFVFLPQIPLQFILYDICFVLLLISFKNKKIERQKTTKYPIILASLLILISTIGIISFGIGINFVANFGKLIVWGVSLLIFPSFIKMSKISDAITKVAIVNSIIVIVQSIFFYIFSIQLPNVFDLGLITFRSIDMSLLETAYRPSALFSEPASYSVYTMIALSMALFSNSKHRVRNAMLFIVGLLLSASTTGLVLLASVLLFYLITSFKNHPAKSLAISFVILPLAATISLYPHIIYDNTGSLGHTLEHTLTKVSSSNSNSRVGGSLDKLNSIDQAQSFLGYGIGNEYYIFNNTVSYMNSFARCTLQYGYLGTTIILIFLLITFIKSKTALAKFLTATNIVLIFTSNTLFTTTSFIMFLIIYLSSQKQKRINT